MIFTETKIGGVWVVEPERLEDERGFFARTFCVKEFEAHGLNAVWVQSSISFNRKKGTLRGMHWQARPHEEIKLVRCTMGAVYDVVLDLRPQSPTHLQWVAEELTGKSRRMLYIPKGVAHGFQTMVDDTEVLYYMSEFYCADSVCGVRWDDPAAAIRWPVGSVPVLSDRDRNWRLYTGD